MLLRVCLLKYYNKMRKMMELMSMKLNNGNNF